MVDIPTHPQFRDLTGKTFHRWQVVSYSGTRNSHHYWSCKCACGVCRDVAAGSLLGKKSLSCGCHKEDAARSRLIDLSGKKFGRLTVLDRNMEKPYPTSWLCRCDCGSEVIAAGANLKRGLTKSCGCIKKENPNHKTHGLSRTPEYNIWSSMKRRCHDPKNPAYRYYGARGISVCRRWRDSFEAFYHDMGPRPSQNRSIDRIDNDKGYSPNNCRWATKSEQAYNRRPKGCLTKK